LSGGRREEEGKERPPEKGVGEGGGEEVVPGGRDGLGLGQALGVEEGEQMEGDGGREDENRVDFVRGRGRRRRQRKAGLGEGRHGLWRSGREEAVVFGEGGEEGLGGWEIGGGRETGRVGEESIIAITAAAAAVDKTAAAAAPPLLLRLISRTGTTVVLHGRTHHTEEQSHRIENPGMRAGGRGAGREGRRKGCRCFLEGGGKGVLHVGRAAEEHVVKAAEEDLEDAVKGGRNDNCYCCCWWWWWW